MASGIRDNNFKSFGDALREENRKRLSRAAIVVERRAKERLSVSGTGVRGPGGTVVRAVKTGRKRIYGAFPSRPGESPHKQTGRLRASVTWELVRLWSWVARVGTNVEYGKHLELGTRFIAPRPWLEVSLADKLGEVRSILTAPWRWNG